MPKQSFHGARYLTEGFPLIMQKGIRRYVFIPLAINLILLSGALIFLANQIGGWKAAIVGSVAGISWLEWLAGPLEYILWPLMFIAIVILVFYLFSFLANWIAAPFNGLLAEAVENHLHGRKARPDEPWSALIKDVPRLFKREWQKLKYYLPRMLGCLLLFLIPVVGLVAPVIWFIFNAWMMAIQYIDYPMDNHKIPFDEMLATLRENRGGSLGFGAFVMLLTLIPVVNLLIMPVAVCGATKLWYEQMRGRHV